MGYVTPEQIAKAKEMDLLTYLQIFEPTELVKVSPNTYCTREHDSLKISNGKWCWHSRGIGGKNALYRSGGNHYGTGGSNAVCFPFSRRKSSQTQGTVAAKGQPKCNGGF